MRDVNIQNNSSRISEAKTLAPKTLLSALEDFANTPNEAERIAYLRKRWPGFLDALTYSGYTISIASPSDPSLKLAESPEILPMWKNFERYRDLVQAAWTGNEPALSALLQLGIEEDASQNRIRPDWRRSGFRYLPRNDFQAAAYELLKRSRQARVCANPDCANPYFLTSDPRRKFCSVECTRPAQKEWRRSWWKRHGKKWRKQRAKKFTKGRRPHGNN